jgi:hypothetical protein
MAPLSSVVPDDAVGSVIEDALVSLADVIVADAVDVSPLASLEPEPVSTPLVALADALADVTLVVCVKLPPPSTPVVKPPSPGSSSPAAPPPHDASKTTAERHARARSDDTGMALVSR